ncbi:MAG: PAS domain S-box protein [Bacteroidales bacterium]|nr:PAS domain S-box protein [Bacteroidales bacterium]
MAGLVVLLFTYALILEASRITFTFSGIAVLHRSMPLLYLLDLFPFIGTASGFFLARHQSGLYKKMDSINQRRKENNMSVASMIRDLAADQVNTNFQNELIDDEIISSLQLLQQQMKENRESAIEAKVADRERTWTSEGLAAFGDLLRANAADEEKLGYGVISMLVKYLGINQGGFFVTRDEQSDRYLEMIACHAYDRKKFPDRKMSWGEGLIGAVAIEKQYFYTDRIPDNYLTITSGLGRANPRYLLIVPILLDDEVFGILELASFHEFPDHQIRFVERVAENTATTLNTMYNNLRTEALLRETQEQAAALRIKEEQVRKNIEELRNTQAEAARQSEQFISFTNTVNHTMIRAEYAPGGTLEYANTRFLRQLGYSGNREVEGKPIEMFIHTSDHAWFREMWERLSTGGPHFEGYMRHVTKLGKELWTMATYTSVRKEDGSVEKILFLAIDATSQKEESLNFESKVNALNALLPQAEFSTDGKILYANQLFEKVLYGAGDRILNSSIFDAVPLSDQERFNEIWEQLVAGKSFVGQVRMIEQSGEEKWILVNLSPVKDTYGEVQKIVFMGVDNTREKELELSLRDQNDQLRDAEQLLNVQALDLNNQVGELQRKRAADKMEMQQEVDRYSDILEHTPIPVIAVNNQGFVVMFNRASEKYFKLKKHSVMNQPGDRIFGKAQPEPLLAAFYLPGKQAIEADHREVTLLLPDRQSRKAIVSVIQTSSGKERIFTLLIHT